MGPITWDVMAGWGDGWTRSRRTPPPVRVGETWRIETGSEKESVRWLVPHPTRGLVEDLLAREHPRNTAVKVFGEPEEWRELFGPGWEQDIPVWLMARWLEPRPVPVLVDGYRAELEHHEDQVAVRVLDDEGSLAARGQVGLGERHAVPDQIVTEPEHQRRGLGSVVMTLLENAAADRGYERAVLGASTQGRELYRAIGWQEMGPRLGMYFRPAEAG